MTAVAGEPRGDLQVLDAGCGSSRCGEWLSRFAARRIAVDLSTVNLARAGALGHAPQLEATERPAWLGERAESFDLIVAADVRVHFGALDGIFSAVAAALRPAGLFAFTLERAEVEGFELRVGGRCAHGADGVRDAINAADLALLSLEPGVLRHEQGEAVDGWVAVVRRPP